MSKELLPTIALLAETAIAGGAAAVAAANPDQGAVIAMSARVLQAAISSGLSWRRERIGAWWQDVCARSETPQEVEARIETRVAEPWGRETVLESIRVLLDAIADEVVAPMGSIAAEYLHDERRPDAFFRGAVRVLADVSREELLDLASLTRDLSKVDAETMAVERAGDGTGKAILRVFHGAVAAQSGEGKSAALQIDCPHHFMRLCHLLRNHGLAVEGASGLWGSSAGPNVMVVEKATMKHLARHLGT